LRRLSTNFHISNCVNSFIFVNKINRSRNWRKKTVWILVLKLDSMNPDPQYYNAMEIPDINSQKRNGPASIPISTLMCLWAIYTFPRSVCCRKICGPILGIYK
jgi:hypothetical protein